MAATRADVCAEVAKGEEAGGKVNLSGQRFPMHLVFSAEWNGAEVQRRFPMARQGWVDLDTDTPRRGWIIEFASENDLIKFMADYEPPVIWEAPNTRPGAAEIDANPSQ